MLSLWMLFAARNAIGALIVFFVFGLPMARAFLAGVEAAQRPDYRVTPQPRSFFFRQAFRRELGLFWPSAWCAILIGVLAWGLFFSHFARVDAPSKVWNMLSSALALYGAAFWLTTGYFIFAPRSQSVASLAAKSAGLGILGWGSVEAFVRILYNQGLASATQAPGFWKCASAVGEFQARNDYDLVPMVQCVVAGILLARAWRVARTQNERWLGLND
jgi:hypothetical protein